MSQQFELKDLPLELQLACEKAEAGESVLISNNGEPKYKIERIIQKHSFIFNMHPGSMVMTPDFCTPMTEEEFTGEK